MGRRGETYGYLVDLPGYGYAQTPLSVKEHWNRLLSKYLQERDQLKGLVLMVDIRRADRIDVQMVQWFAPLARPIHVLLTKCDKLTRNDANKTLFAVRKQLQELAGDWGTVQLFSSTNRVGLEQAGEIIGQWIMQARPESKHDRIGAHRAKLTYSRIDSAVLKALLSLEKSPQCEAQTKHQIN